MYLLKEIIISKKKVLPIQFWILIITSDVVTFTINGGAPWQNNTFSQENSVTIFRGVHLLFLSHNLDSSSCVIFKYVCTTFQHV